MGSASVRPTAAVCAPSSADAPRHDFPSPLKSAKWESWPARGSRSTPATRSRYHSDEDSREDLAGAAPISLLSPPSSRPSSPANTATSILAGSPDAFKGELIRPLLLVLVLLLLLLMARLWIYFFLIITQLFITVRPHPRSLFHTDVYFYCCSGRNSQRRTHIRSAPLHGCPGYAAADDFYYTAHIMHSPRIIFLKIMLGGVKKKTQKTENKNTTLIKSSARRKKPWPAKSHRRSKWSCNSTCFDSSGRICAVVCVRVLACVLVSE